MSLSKELLAESILISDEEHDQWMQEHALSVSCDNVEEEELASMDHSSFGVANEFWRVFQPKFDAALKIKQKQRRAKILDICQDLLPREVAILISEMDD